ncbi:tripartite tricarboxylate transporter substrate binding protein [Arsenicitalea aurantiaca]|uniref:Tripartite tricarboxylate transporter substrate binding protein n=1 Tax=Arsenicitalea aurantiaca TaxID=1783274 RepID=A0A433X5H4_9HYPH|nr:tripartite tricarboxylate transporter substrate binding protein [Arsenicitalea aurantiaca]RUT29298.1 tripartite tricarboxylate transporter substrate binding protein [Arsenicitalea aurantiaca]
MSNIKRRTVLAGGAALGAAAFLPSVSFGQSNYPNRPLTMVVPWGAGGGTDATARIIASIVEQRLGQPINVVNRTGGAGVVGHSAIATAPADGYTIGIITVEIAMMHHQGLTDLDPESYTPLGLVNIDPAGIQVSSDSPYTTHDELVEALRAAPAGQFTASGTGQGGIWHLALIGWLQSLGLEANHVTWVPSEGAAPAMQELAAGGVDIVTCSVPEAQGMIDAGRARSLAIMSAERSDNFPDLPSLGELGIEYSMGAWRGIAAPAGLPDDIRQVLTDAVAEAAASDTYIEFMDGRGFGVRYLPPEEQASFMMEADAAMGDAMAAAGLAQG